MGLHWYAQAIRGPGLAGGLEALLAGRNWLAAEWTRWRESTAAAEMRVVLLEALRLAFGGGAPSPSTPPPPEVVLFDHRGLSVAEQASLYARAAVVIGVHGAGFANALWAPSGAHIVEIVPVDVHLDFQCGLTPFWQTATLLGQRKHAFIAYTGRMFEPFALPVVEFIAFMRASGVL